MNKAAEKHPRHAFFALGIGAFLLGAFLKLTSEFREGEVTVLDQKILTYVSQHRQNELTEIVKSVTTLGSPRILALVTGFGLVFLGFNKRWRDAGYLAAVAGGTSLLTNGMKHYISRPRPSDTGWLTVVSGFSYPSGHSLASTAIYLFLAFVVGSTFGKVKMRGLLMVVALGLAASICLSRVYLGVHYASDVMSGFFLGSAWAFLLAAAYLRT